VIAEEKGRRLKILSSANTEKPERGRIVLASQNFQEKGKGTGKSDCP